METYKYLGILVSLALKIASMHWYNDGKTTYITEEEDWLQRPEIRQTTEASTEEIVEQTNAIRTNIIKARIDKTQKIADVDFVVTEPKRSIIV